MRIALVERLHAERSPVPQAAGNNRGFDQWGRETHHAARRLCRSPGFSLAAISTLALALGANTAVFALLNGVVLADLPYPSAERLIALDHAAPGVGLPSGVGMSTGLYREYAALPSIEAIAIYDLGEGTVAGIGDAERVKYLFTTPSLGGILGMRPSLGRWFADAEGVAGAAPVVVLTDGSGAHALALRRVRLAQRFVSMAEVTKLWEYFHEVVRFPMPVRSSLRRFHSLGNGTGQQDSTIRALHD